MQDETTTLAELRHAVADFCRERDWEQFHAPKNLSMAISAEAGELMEHFLWTTPEDSRRILHDPARKARVAEELADVLMFAFQFANQAEIDLASAIRTKVVRNAERYPADTARGRLENTTNSDAERGFSAEPKQHSPVVKNLAQRLLARVKQRREGLGLTQEAFAEKAGLGYKYYQHVEAGRRRDLRLSTIEKLAKACELKLWELMEVDAPLPLVAEADTSTDRARPARRSAKEAR
jgi:NTP pyrophosphatase (non-canonical NTP hydrolase)/DNA-binding XRE family transcriptional regulator